jgi:hypothetical protein
VVEVLLILDDVAGVDLLVTADGSGVDLHHLVDLVLDDTRASSRHPHLLVLPLFRLLSLDSQEEFVVLLVDPVVRLLYFLLTRLMDVPVDLEERFVELLLPLQHLDFLLFKPLLFTQIESGITFALLLLVAQQGQVAKEVVCVGDHRFAGVQTKLVDGGWRLVVPGEDLVRGLKTGEQAQQIVRVAGVFLKVVPEPHARGFDFLIVIISLEEDVTDGLLENLAGRRKAGCMINKVKNVAEIEYLPAWLELDACEHGAIAGLLPTLH